MMTRFAVALMSLMMFMTVWSGTAAHAADVLDCPAAIEQVYADGEASKDQVPGPVGHVLHHHGCTSFAVHALSAGPANANLKYGVAAKIDLDDNFRPGSHLDAALRPPIA